MTTKTTYRRAFEKYFAETEAPFTKYGFVENNKGVCRWGDIAIEGEDEPLTYGEALRLVEAEFMPEDFDSSRPYKERPSKQENKDYLRFIRSIQRNFYLYGLEFPQITEHAKTKEKTVKYTILSECPEQKKETPLQVINLEDCEKPLRVRLGRKERPFKVTKPFRVGCTCKWIEYGTGYKKLRCGFCQYYGVRR